MLTELQKQQRRDNACFAKASARGQRTFTVVEQDKTSPKTILFWIMENLTTAPREKLEDAFESAMGMRFSAIDKKNAD